MVQVAALVVGRMSAAQRVGQLLMLHVRSVALRRGAMFFVESGHSGVMHDKDLPVSA